MFDLDSLFGGALGDPDKKLIGQTVEQDGKKYILVLQTPAFFGGFLGAQTSDGKTAKRGEPLVLVIHEGAAKRQMDAVETKSRHDLVSKSVLLCTDSRVRRHRDLLGGAHSETCPAGERKVGFLKFVGPLDYRGHQDGTAGTDKEVPFLDQFCEGHRALIVEVYTEQGWEPGVWPPRKVVPPADTTTAAT